MPSSIEHSQLKFSTKVVRWYQLHGRKDLPWQRQQDQVIDPYCVWLSEIMLQQTQVVKVIEYFNRFISALPTLDDLADADEQQVLALWSGLGYYNRARNLHRAAKICQRDYQSQMPCDLPQLMALPGIGRSTAAAILSLAYDQAEPILDGNVKRVFARHFLVKGEPNKGSTVNKLWQLAEQHRELKQPAFYAQGLMDLGAKICTKHKPLCQQCPIMESCAAKADDVIAEYPEKKQKVKQKSVDLHAILYKWGDQLGLIQRSDEGIWPSLWFLPTYATQTALSDAHPQAQNQFSLTHKLTHRILHIHIYTLDVEDGNTVKLHNMAWISRNQLSDRPHPKALNHILNQHDNH
ncbi:MAG: A/G-specific adenine glycosylase [marine bacterium B5-7]|nr:MAG: A/G-specific adenine glycosylase [marine bacterium B5-7]